MEDFKIEESTTAENAGMGEKCPHCEFCGGCIHQGVPYERQLAEKEREVRRLLEAKNVTPDRIDPIEGCPSQYGYRNKMEYTFGDFVKTDAQEMAKLYAIVRQWSEKYGVTLTDADREKIAQQRAQYVSYYGSEEAYQNQLRLLGISEESFNTINEAAYYYADLAKLFCNEDGAQRPSDETLIAYAADNGYCTAKTLYVRTSGLDEAALAEKRSQLEAAAEQLRAAEDKDAAYLELAASLGIETNGSALTFRASDVSDAAAEILSPLQSGEVSDIVEGSDVLYVFLMQEPDCTALAQYYFKQLVSDAQTNAKVKTSRAYDKIDSASFYTGLQEARSALATSLQGDGANAAG